MLRSTIFTVFLLLLPVVIVKAENIRTEGGNNNIAFLKNNEEKEEEYYAASDDDDEFSFEDYVTKFGKSYYYDNTTNSDDDEYHRRKQIFEINLAKIIQHNSQQDKTYTLEINEFADLMDDEIPTGYDKSFHPAWTSSQVDASGRHHHYHPFTLDHSILKDLPDAVDWRTKGGITTPIKNQGGCGSCWAFAATAALESHIAIKTGSLFSLSMQELVSCTPNPNECGGQGGCTGSTAEIAYDFIAKHGVVEEWRFGYQSFTGKVVDCTFKPVGEQDDASDNNNKIPGAVASIVGFTNLPSNHYESLLVAVATMGPVVINVAASGWHLYQGGVYNDTDSETRDINHAVVLEGYGTDQETGQDYWLVRNSWGPRWGENGYIRLLRVDPTTLDDPDSDCKIDDQPGDGVACKKDDNGKDVTPKKVKVCGTSGILFDGVIPIGGHLL